MVHLQLDLLLPEGRNCTFSYAMFPCRNSYFCAYACARADEIVIFFFFCLFYRHSALPSNLTRFCTRPAGVLRKCRIQKPKKTILHIKWAFRVGKVGQVNNYVNGSSFGPCDRPTAVAFIFGTLHWKYFAIFSHWFSLPFIIFLFFFLRITIGALIDLDRHVRSNLNLKSWHCER